MYFEILQEYLKYGLKTNPVGFALLCFSHTFYERAFLFLFFFCVGVVDTVGFYTQLYHLRLTFFAGKMPYRCL